MGFSLIIGATIIGAIWFSYCFFAATPASAETAKIQSIVPQEVRTAITQAVQDPVLSTEFLCQVWQDQEIQKYLSAYPSLTVSINGGGFTFWVYASNEKAMTDPILIIVPTDGTVMHTSLSVETKELVCAESQCRYTEEFISSVKQSAFWAAMKTAITATTTKEPRTARK
ncbi:MAG: hypothetical protein C3F02_02205 [Parcubacteria group bacterium]|nr:MAG: hypothetical protein C3F02_02205 [Parcubacteria group bacterium]